MASSVSFGGKGALIKSFSQICELAKGKDVFWAFMDLETAQDRLDRKALWEVLQIYKIGGKLSRVVNSFYSSSRAWVWIRNGEIKWFVNVGLLHVVLAVQCVHGRSGMDGDGQGVGDG